MQNVKRALQRSFTIKEENDSYHCNVVKKHMHAVREASVAIDYEL